MKGDNNSSYKLLWEFISHLSIEWGLVYELYFKKYLIYTIDIFREKMYGDYDQLIYSLGGLCGILMFYVCNFISSLFPCLQNHWYI